MRRIIFIFISIFVLDAVVVVGCKSKSSLSSFSQDECKALNEYVASMWNSPSLVSNTTLSESQFNQVFNSGAYNRLGFISALFESAKYSRSRPMRESIKDLECKIASLQNEANQGGSENDTTQEECSSRYVCPDCGIDSLSSLLSEYKERLAQLDSCGFDSSLINTEELSEDQDLAVYSAILVNNTSAYNEELIRIWEEAASKTMYSYKEEGVSADEIGMINSISSFVQENKYISGKITDGVYSLSKVETLCKRVEGLSSKVEKIKNSKVVGFCVSCIATLTGMCKATMKDVKEFTKSQVLGTQTKMRTYIDNFIRQIVTSVVLCTAKRLFKKAWPTMVQKVREFVLKAQKKVIENQSDYKPSVKSAFLSAVCEVGLGIIGDSISMDREVNYDTPCKAMRNIDKSKIASCTRTAATMCPIFLNSGYVDVSSFLPDTNGNVWLNILYDFGTLGTTFTCQAAGKEVAVLCSTIAAAASQIKTAILTGNNDWAHCLGFDQGGACVGEMWAEYFGGMSLSYARAPIERLKKSKYDVFEGEMCMCTRKCYQDRVGLDKKYKEEVLFSYASDVSDRLTKYNDCKSFNGRKIKHAVSAKSGATSTYAKYGDCHLVSVSFKNQSDPDAAIPLDGTTVNYRYLDPYGNYESGTVWKSVNSQSFEGCISN